MTWVQRALAYFWYWLQTFFGIYNIERFGAKTDGTDASIAITDALNAAGANGRIIIPAGKTFTVKNPVTVSNSGVIIEGGGTLFKAASSNFVTITITANSVVLRNITIDGNKANQTTTGQTNDEVYLSGVSHCEVSNCTIKNSAGNAIHGANAGYNTIRNNYISAAHDNGIMLANKSTDYNLIEGNLIDTTVTQDGIFLTASANSTATTDYIYNNKVINNTVLNAGDSGIESGIHAVGTILEANHVVSSYNAALLVRDNQHFIVKNNRVDQTSAPTGGTPDGIDIAQQLNDVPNKYGIIEGNNVIGNGQRYGIYLYDNNYIDVQNNVVSSFTRNIYVSGMYHSVTDNQSISSGTWDHISLDESGPSNCDYTTVEQNKLYGGTHGIIVYNKIISGITLRDNQAQNLSGNIVHADGSTVGTNPGYCYGNYGGTLSNYGVFSSSPNGSTGQTVPLTQNGEIVLANGGDVGTVVIKFGSDYAVVNVLGTTYSVVANSANVATTLSGSAWGIGIDSTIGNAVVLRRVGATTTGNIPYTMSRILA